jgi:hypothetical protein
MKYNRRGCQTASSPLVLLRAYCATTPNRASRTYGEIEGQITLYETNRLAPTHISETESPTLTITIDPTLNNIKVCKLSGEKILELKQVITNLRFSNSYYLIISARYKSQTLKYAVEENQPAKVLNDIIRELTGAYPDLDEALQPDS